MLLLPEEIVSEIIDILPQKDKVNLSLVSSQCYKLCVPHLYGTIYITDAVAVRRRENRYNHYGSVVIHNEDTNSLVQYRPGSVKDNKVLLLTRTLEEKPEHFLLIQKFITDILTSDVVYILHKISSHALRLKQLVFSPNWFKDVTWNINNFIKALESLEIILTQSFDDIEDLSVYPNLKSLKVIKSQLNHDFSRTLKPPELNVIRKLTSLAIEDLSFAKMLNQYCKKSGEKLFKLNTFTYKIDCLSAPQKDKFNFDLIEGFLNFESIKNFKLVVWYTEDIEQYALNFLSKLNPNLCNVENFELKRNMMAYTLESPTFNDTFTLTNLYYLTFFNSNLANLHILQLSGNYINKDFIINSSSFLENKSTQLAIFMTNFHSIFKNSSKLQVLIIDEFINIKNSSILMKFLYQLAKSHDPEQSLLIKAKLKHIATYGYAQFFIDAFDDQFDENVDCTEYDLVKYCLKKLRENYVKFSSLDDPSYHFFKDLNFDFEKGNLVNRINYIKSLDGRVDFHKKFFHKDKSWKMAGKCGCNINDYKVVIDLFVLAMSDYIQILGENLRHLEMVILNGLFFKIDRLGPKPTFHLLFH